ncbi:MAG: hypothetical protein WBV94_29160 [Blastocatellia bacterium]
MKRILQTSVLSVCLFMIGVTGILIATPVTIFAAECSVGCANGSTITCTGSRCAVDSGTQSCWGSTTGEKQCAKGEGENQ